MTMSLAIPSHKHAPNWGDRTPGSPTPGVPATPSPRQRRTLRHRGLKNGHSRPRGRSAKNASKCGKITPPQKLNILSMNSSEAPPGTAGNLLLHEHSEVHNLVELRHGHLSLHTTGVSTTLSRAQRLQCGSSADFSTPALGNCTGTTGNIDHLVSVLQLENFNGFPEQDHGNLSLHHDRDADDLVQKTDELQLRHLHSIL